MNEVVIAIVTGIFSLVAGGGGELELLGTVTLEEETTTMQISIDLQGNAFELEELYAYIKIPKTTAGVQPYIYFAPGITCYRMISNLTAESYIVISWKREEIVAEIKTYQYNSFAFKDATIVEITDNIAVNQLRLSVFSGAFPIGTEVTLKGKKV